MKIHWHIKAICLILSIILKSNRIKDNWGVRLGLGLQYNITDNVAINGMARYIKIDDSSDDVVEDMTELSVGARYSF